MSTPLILSQNTMTTAAVLLLAVVAIESGGYYMLSINRGRQALTGLQVSFARAGHAHAGVLVILSLVAQLYVDASGAGGVLGAVAREGVPIAAILMPAGFFLSSMGGQRTRPNRFIWLLYAGTVSLAGGVIGLAVALLIA